MTKRCISIFVLCLLQRTLSSGQIIPLIDHHQHLFSPAKAEVVYEAPLAEIRLPNQLADLIHNREQRQKDVSALILLYTADALMLNTQDEDNPSWVRGKDAIAKEIAAYFDSPYRITPVAVRIDGQTAFVTGYYTERKSAHHIAHCFLSLRNEEGVWRIAAEIPSFPGPPRRDPSTADQLISQLDDAGIGQAVVLSVAYQWGSPEGCPGCTREQEYVHVKAENDYIAQQIAKYRDRLTGFCSFNPLKDYALEELTRCSKLPGMKGLKLHFGNSRVDLRIPEHVQKVRSIFHAANQSRVPIVVHLWTDSSYEQNGGERAQIFLHEILPEAPDVTIQIAHMAGGGRATFSALAVFADAFGRGDPRTRNLYFDTATVTEGETREGLRQDAMFMRKIGITRILYGTDTAPPNPPARVSWALFRSLVPLTDAEFRIIASNRAPYFR